MNEYRRDLAYESDYNNCFGCGPQNPAGLHLEFSETEEGVEVHYTANDNLRGAPGVVHGGIQATLLDEALCMTAYAKLGVSVVTGELTVRYEKPVPTGTPLRVRGRVIERRGRSAFIEGEITLAASGEVLTRGKGRFFAMPDEASKSAE